MLTRKMVVQSLILCNVCCASENLQSVTTEILSLISESVKYLSVFLLPTNDFPLKYICVQCLYYLSILYKFIERYLEISYLFTTAFNCISVVEQTHKPLVAEATNLLGAIDFGDFSAASEKGYESLRNVSKRLSEHYKLQVKGDFFHPWRTGRIATCTTLSSYIVPEINHSELHYTKFPVTLNDLKPTPNFHITPHIHYSSNLNMIFSNKMSSVSNEERSCHAHCFACKQDCPSTKDITNHMSLFHPDQMLSSSTLYNGTFHQKNSEDTFHCAVSAKKTPIPNISSDGNCGQSWDIRNHIISNQYTCTICEKSFNHSTHLESHLKMHSDEKLYYCTICANSFTCNDELEVHLRIHCEKAPSVGTNCAESFDHNAAALQNHVSTHLGEKPYSCAMCDKSFSKNCALSAHLKIHSGENMYSCTACNKSFNNNAYKMHMKKMHFVDRPYSCTHCNKFFKSKSNLMEHLIIHSGKRLHRCTICKKTFKRNAALTLHARIHSGLKPYTCTICNKSFSDSSNFKSHQKTHSDKTLQFFCTICSKSFTQHANLKLHLRIHFDEKPYSCNVCHKTFYQKTNLKSHIQVHTDEAPHVCMICKKSFRHNNSLKLHLRTHSGEKPFVCTKCGKSFSRRDTLKFHLISHSGKKAYCCTVCNKSFTRSGSLNNHLRTHTA